eukprot:scaffold30378_cov135-Amphora_coffeaeformis.AAC.1
MQFPSNCSDRNTHRKRPREMPTTGTILLRIIIIKRMEVCVLAHILFVIELTFFGSLVCGPEDFVRIVTRQGSVHMIGKFNLRRSGSETIRQQELFFLRGKAFVLIGLPQCQSRGIVLAYVMRHVGADAGNLLQLANPNITGSIETGCHVTHVCR